MLNPSKIILKNYSALLWEIFKYKSFKLKIQSIKLPGTFLLKSSEKSDIGFYKMGLCQTPLKSFLKMYGYQSEMCDINIK